MNDLLEGLVGAKAPLVKVGEPRPTALCRRCNRVLRGAVSVYEGIGRDCAKHEAVDRLTMDLFETQPDYGRMRRESLAAELFTGASQWQ